MAGKFHKKKINLAVQRMNLKKLFPESTVRINRNLLIWQVEITPSELSRTYSIQLKYKIETKPEIYVLKPELIDPFGKGLPHIYPGERLCLYYPGIGEWRGDLLLAETIAPWISEWLLYYEIWLVTGKWFGGSVHPE